MLSGERRGPIDYEQLVVDLGTRQQITPSALRNSSEAGRFYEGLLDSPVRELANPRIPTPQPSSRIQVGDIPMPGITVGR